MKTIHFTKQELDAGFETVRAVADAIREVGRIPAGHLYAAVMSKMSYEAFEKIIGILTRAKLVRREPSHELVWIG